MDVSIGWWTKSLHRKWLEITKHPFINGCLGFQAADIEILRLMEEILHQLIWRMFYRLVTRVLYDVLFGAGTGVSSRNPFSMHPKKYSKAPCLAGLPPLFQGARPSAKDAGNARISNAELWFISILGDIIVHVILVCILTFFLRHWKWQHHLGTHEKR